MEPGTLTRCAILLSASVLLCGAEAPLQLSSGPYLLLDDFLIARSTNVERVICEPVRLPTPVVTGPEDKCFQPYVTVLRDPATQRFRLWYGVPENASQSHLAYMESDDGVHWQRPHRVLQDPARIQFGVSILDEGSSFPDPSRRLKYGYWNDGGLQVASSPNGLDWTSLAPGPVLRHNHDINCIFRDPVRNRYLALVSSVRAGLSWKGQLRVPMASVSDDLLHWSEPVLALAPDSLDEGETQFYSMGGLVARGPLLVGMLRVLRDDLPADPGGPVAGLGYTVLAWSHDGKTWQRDRSAFLPCNPKPGAWDHAMTWADCQLVVGDEVLIYYGGYARGHKVERFSERQLGLARLPLDRYVARTAKARGRLLTRPVILGGASLTLNAQVEGELRVRILDLAGAPLPGFDLPDCAPVRGDSLRHPVRWAGGPAPTNRPVQLELELNRGRLFALGIEDLQPHNSHR